MSRSKKDGRHGGGHKMHWTHKARGDMCPYGYMDTIRLKCSQCKMFTICGKWCWSMKDRTAEKYKDEV